MKSSSPLVRILLLLFPLWMVAACHYPQPGSEDHWVSAADGALDSIVFRATHHYWRNYNFAVRANTLTLEARRPGSEEWSGTRDSMTVVRDEPLVVADVALIDAADGDSVWVKVARDQFTQGWVSERRLLDCVVPDDPISRFVRNFSDSRMLLFLSCIGLALLFCLVQIVRRKDIMLVHVRDIKSFYPTLLCLIVSGAAALYGSVQRFVPETWAEFYFHPTLNPFVLPPILALFIASVWLMVVVAIAVADDLRHQPDIGSWLTYLTGLAGVCMVLYLFFSLSVQIYIGYPLLLAYWVFALRCHRRSNRVRYLCGNCGKPIDGCGPCRHCGARNE